MLGVKWENYADGPTTDFINTAYDHNVKVRFTVPSGTSNVGIYFTTSAISRLTTWATVDNFKLVRIN